MGTQYYRKVMLGVLVLFVSMLPVMSGAQDADMEFPLLLPTGMPAAEAPEDVLPTGAIAYIRANNINVLLENVDSLLTTFVPEKALPPDLQSIFESPQPFLTFFAMQALGQAVPLEQLSELIGIALDRPASLAFYPMPPDKGFVLSVPVANATVITGIAQGALMPEGVEKGEIGEVTYYHVSASNYDLPNDVYIATSETTAFFCGSMDVMQMLVNSADMGTLNTDPVIAKGIEKYGDRDLLVVLSPGMLKPQLPMMQQQFAQILTPVFMQARMGMQIIPPTQRMMIDARLRVQFGIDGLDQLLDYTEAYATGIYRVVFEEVVNMLTNLDGLALSLNIEQTFQNVALTLFSQDIQGRIQPLPFAEIKQALDALPGGKDMLVAVGKTPETEPSPIGTAILTAIEEELSAKELPMDGFLALKDFYQTKPHHTPLTSKVDWSMHTVGSIAEKTDFSQFNNLGELLNYAGKRLASGQLTIPATMMPAIGTDVVAQYFEEKSAMLTQKGENYAAMREKLPFREPIIDISGQFQQEDLEDGLQQLTLEKIYTTRRGFFGYQQHALVNRQIVLHQHTDEYELLYVPGPDAASMKAVVEERTAPVPGATVKLIEQAPEGTTMMSTLRALHLVPGLLDMLVGVEEVVHRELDAFLANAQEIVDASGEEDIEMKLLEARQSLPMLLVSLNIDEEGKLYATLPGGLHYPRPTVVPMVKELFSELSANVSEVGGSASFAAVQPGEWEFSAIQSLEGLAFLVKSVGNAFYDSYMATPDGMGQLFATLQHPSDFQDLEEEQILVNPVWESLLEGDGLPFFGAAGGAKQSRTAADMRAIGVALGSYQVDYNSFPQHPGETEIWELEIYPEYYEGMIADGWEMPFIYLSDEDGENYILISYGKDGSPGGWESEFDPDLIYMNGEFLAPYDLADSYDTYEQLNVALLLAVEANAVDVVASLLQSGADMDIENEDGDSALAIANELEYQEIVDLLLEYGATPLSE